MVQYYSCKLDVLNQLLFFPSNKVRWLELHDDFPLIQKYYKILTSADINESDFSQDQWRFCALFENGKIASFAGAMYMTDKNWEIGAVSTHPQYRGKGYAKIVCSYVARYILESGKQATCNTKIDNYAMKRVMQAIGMIEQ